jgi:hypothetical protein
VAGPARDVARGQLDLDAGGAQPLDAASVGARIRVDRRDHHAGDPGGDQGSEQGGLRPWCAHGSRLT